MTDSGLSPHDVEIEVDGGLQAGIAGRDLAALRQAVERQTRHLDSLSARVDSLVDREPDWRPLVLDAHEQLRRSDEELASSRMTLERARVEISRREEERISLRAALEQTHAEIQRRDEALASLRPTLDQAHEENARLEEALVAHRSALEQAHAEIQRRQEALASLEAELRDERDQNLGRRAQIASLEAELARAQEELGDIRSSRLWRLGAWYWLARDRARAMLGLG